MASINLIAVAVGGFKPMPMELEPFVTAAKNARNRCHITTGATFQAIEVISNITDVALIQKIELELNGRTIVNLTGAEVKTLIEGYTKRTRAAGRFVIPFWSAEARTIDGMRSGELVTLPSDNMVLIVQLGDTAAVVPELRARALVTPSQDARYILPIMDSVNINAPGSGENIYQWQERSAALNIRRLHFAAADITRIQVFRDDLKVFDATAADNAADLSEGGDNAPVGGYFHFDPAHAHYVLQGLFPTIAQRKLEFRYWKSAGGEVRVVREMLEQVAQLPSVA